MKGSETNRRLWLARCLEPPRLLIALSLLPGIRLAAQTSTGELRLHVVDPTGAPVVARAAVDSDAQHRHQKLTTDVSGDVRFALLPFGKYRVIVQAQGFLSQSSDVIIKSAVPLNSIVMLPLPGVATEVEVESSDTLMDLRAAGTERRLGAEEIEQRTSSLPGRGVTDLVDSEPGWLYEGSAVLHPRGSEYQTQFVLNGIPLTENRSPGSGSELTVNDVQSMNIYTAGIPAEYGRKLGGVIEVNTVQDTREGLHGKTVLSGGSFSTADAYLQAQYGYKGDELSVSGDGAYTDWYENPPVTQNFTNSATVGSFAAEYEHDTSQRDRVTLDFTHEFARFLVPNEQLQETAGQRQHRETLESLGTASWQHIFSGSALANVSGMVRDDSALLHSNAKSTPIVASQNRGFREGYLKASVTGDRGHHEWKAGFETDLMNVHEQFAYDITDPSQFDPGTPASFQTSQSGRDSEGAVFVEDSAHWAHWNVAAGLRWDDYSLLVHESAFSPRLAISRSLLRDNLVVHFSYDRVFQTPAIENLLLSSSNQVSSLSSSVLRLPVRPSKGNYYELGASKSFWSRFRVDANGFSRRMSNFADDNPLLDTSVSFPISFQKASIYGVEGKAELAHWGGLSGYVTYSYMVGSASLPVTGGLFLGETAGTNLQPGGRFWVSQDQRNTANTRFRYQLPKGFWVATGAQSGSGLPEQFSGTVQDATALYGQKLVNRVDFAGGRVRPSLAVSASAGVDHNLSGGRVLHLQAGVEDLNDRLNLIDFQGLFSGNAVAPPRSYNLRLTYTF